jgi:DNA-directed RNA polymerase specialized sigma24 family protein
MTVLAVIMAIEDEQDRAFVEEVYAAYADKMYRIAYDVVGNHHDAQDCVQETIVKIIDRLDHCYRDVLVLRGLGLDHGEIADLMGISVELVRKRYQRARQKLLEMGGEALYGCRNA